MKEMLFKTYIFPGADVRVEELVRMPLSPRTGAHACPSSGPGGTDVKEHVHERTSTSGWSRELHGFLDKMIRCSAE